MTVSLVRIMTLEDDLLDEEEEDEKKDGKSASAMLHRFCKWQQNHNDKDGEGQGHFDTAVLLTRENICRNPALQRCDTLGLAELGTMCDPRASCSIIQDNGLSAAFTVAHELGHVLNIPHDDDSKCLPYMSVDKMHFVMSRMLDHNTFPWAWSNCSRHYLTEYLDAGYGDCLLNSPNTNYLRNTGRGARTDLAGETYDASQQCKFVFGDQFEICSYMPVCKRLWCTSGEEEAGCRTQHMPWADGTACGPDRWCQRGECRPRSPQADTVHGAWGEWGEWGRCSRTCGGGIRRSERSCNSPTPSNGGSYCLGRRVRYESCNRPNCPAGSTDFREAQCATFNGNNFNIQGLPADVEWVPKYTGIKTKDRCKLFCRVADSSAYYLLNERVLDGTPCTPDTDNMCVNGICVPAGCDHILHSDVRADKCGVCGGDNSTCHVIKGYFDSSNHQIRYGYNRVVRVPAGATSLDIRQMSHDDTSRDDNYLALMDPDDGEYILNGNFVVSMFKKVMQYGGVLLGYTGSDSVTERVNCSKPLEKDLELYVLSVGKLRSPNVVYEYTVSVGKKETYHWRRHPQWTECNMVCNGTQYKDVECVRKSDAAPVSESHCYPTPRPDRLETPCNTHCTLIWKVTHQSECSSPCGAGQRRNVVRCFQSFPLFEMSPISEQYCQHITPRPPAVEACQGACDPTHWRFGDWSPCSRTCGGGVQNRSAVCVTSSNQPLADSRCNQAERRLTRPCGSAECPGWRVGNWSACSKTCGAGQRLRPYWCARGDSYVAQSYCDPTLAPSQTQPCEMAACAQWRALAWDECSVSCGQGASRRSVICTTPDGHRIDDSLCGGDRPKMTRACERPPCPLATTTTTAAPPWQDPAANSINDYRHFVWRWGNWSACSKTCGLGVHLRSVACYNTRSGHVQPKRACQHIERPIETERCRVGFCGKWLHGDWSKCSTDCGQGLRKRQVSCVSISTNARLRARECDNSTRPAPREACPWVDCPGSKSALSHDEPSSDWVTGAWGGCSRTCGGGFQQRQVKCRSGEGATGCDPSTRPKPTAYCNTDPCPQWNTGQWSECNATCGSGARLRRVRCQDHLGRMLPDHKCSSTGRPADSRRCRLPTCPSSRQEVRRRFSWRVSRWSKCSQRCDAGFKVRAVACVNAASGRTVAHGYCTERKPRAKRRCRRRPCPFRWVPTAWSECSRSCGLGVQYRQLSCHRLNMFGWLDPEPAAAALCPPARRPRSARKCHRSCSARHRWKAGEWSQCSESCGRYGLKNRTVRCMNARGKRVSRRHCLKSERPRRRKRCNRRPCGPLSCAEVREKRRQLSDGEYYLMVAGANISIYCHGMNGSQPPVEYLTLPSKPNDFYSNFAEIDEKRLLNPETCPYNGSRVSSARCRKCVQSRSPHAGLTVFTRVRLNITSLNIIPRDFSFAQQRRGRPVHFGEAGDCYSSSGCPQGRFGINLSGTGLRVASTTNWVGVGNKPTVRITKNRDRTVVKGTCGGYCGTCRADSPGGIKLDVAPP
ncbi:A disintegrin and metalloproteinase with thrombospondin motifs 9-like isoform X1 [Pollicipes pollicipes]|uniref:A disintegrin and metalloproteinase with thrombospondin motifs 9-like isoform X1 n=1 Tax=Pollicipes pollicipes TaxID=41117 RepID=UPI0018852A79|nr:A disintegrin and metalloproteinase with thrombospondin motifs 9-like isoform X1 [Pollicipes pollicipes]